MRAKKFKLMWTDIRRKGDEITPTYYFDIDKLNELGYQDGEIFEFIGEMKTMAEKEIEIRSNKDETKNTL